MRWREDARNRSRDFDRKRDGEAFDAEQRAVLEGRAALTEMFTALGAAADAAGGIP